MGVGVVQILLLNLLPKCYLKLLWTRCIGKKSRMHLSFQFDYFWTCCYLWRHDFTDWIFGKKKSFCLGSRFFFFFFFKINLGLFVVFPTVFIRQYVYLWDHQIYLTALLRVSESIKLVILEFTPRLLLLWQSWLQLNQLQNWECCLKYLYSYCVT